MAYQFSQTGEEIQTILNSVEDKYEKPSGGIPLTDLTSTVQAKITSAVEQDSGSLSFNIGRDGTGFYIQY